MSRADRLLPNRLTVAAFTVALIAAGVAFRAWPPRAEASSKAPIVLVDQFNASATANTDILPSALTVSHPTTAGIAVMAETAGTFSIRETSGGTTQEIKFNTASDLTADAGYTFVWPLVPGKSYQFRHDATSTVRITVLGFQNPGGP